MFVAYRNNNRIQKFTNTENFITEWGTFCTMSMSSTSESLPNPSGDQKLNLSVDQQLDPNTGEQLNSTVLARASSQNARSIDTQDETASEFP